MHMLCCVLIPSRSLIVIYCGSKFAKTTCRVACKCFHLPKIWL